MGRPEHPYAGLMEVLFKPITDKYKPNQAVLNELHSKDTTIVFGPSGTGKNAVMRVSELSTITGVTSRPQEPRDLNGGSRYREFLKLQYGHEREQLVRKLIGGWFVQAIVNPANNEFYGSEPQDYPDSNSVLDVTAMEYLRIRGLFGVAHGVMLVPPTLAVLNSRIRGRNNGDLPPDYRARIREDAAGMAAILCNPEEVSFVLNDDIEAAAAQVVTIAEGGQQTERQRADGHHAACIVFNEMRHSGLLAD